MATPRDLKNPPITEALVDFRIANVSELEADPFNSLRSVLKDRYPNVEERRKLQANVEVKREGISAVSKDLGFLGMFFKSPDGRLTAQFRDNGFTLNRLPPYEGGQTLFAEALDLWQRYAAIVRPEAVIRLAVRYINKLHLPLRTGESLERFLTAAPELPGELPQNVSDFVSRVTTKDLDQDVTIIVTQILALAPPTPGSLVPLILDLDVFKEGTLPVAAPELDAHFRVLREFKNRVFFSLLTEDTVRLYI